MIFEENFIFLRKLIKKYKSHNITEEEKNDFQRIFKIWCFNEISLFSLCIISGNYKLAELIIRNISEQDLKEVDLIQLTQFVKMLELPYFAYVRIDLLDLS